MHALLWLQAASTNGATHVRIPDCSANSKSKFARQFAQGPLTTPRNAAHAPVYGPAVHAAAALCRSLVEQTFWRTGGGSTNTAGQLGYGPGHWDCLLVQARGETRTSHVDGGTRAVQSWQVAPCSPHCVLAKPAWQLPLGSQHPSQLCSHTGAPSGDVHTPNSHWLPMVVQLVHCRPLVPQWGASKPPRQLPSASQHPAQLAGPQIWPASEFATHC